MTDEELQGMVRGIMADEIRAEDERRAAEQATAAKRQQEIEDAVLENTRKLTREFAKTRRLPTTDRDQPQGGITPGSAPYQTAFADTRKYDGLSLEDQAFMCGVLDSAKRDSRSRGGVSQSALKALAIKIAEDKGPMGEAARSDLKAADIDPRDVVDAAKANELDYSTSAGFGDEWVGVEYSRRLWAAIRSASTIVSMIPSVEVPQGSESIIIPLESTDPTWYKVAQATANNSTTLRPDGTVTSSRVATANKTLSVSKLGARVTYSAELEEDSFVPWANQLRTQLETSGAENLEAVVIDGDTDVSATTNINHIAGTPGGTENYLLFNGFRKSCLITTTANSRNAGGSLVDTDFLATLKLLGIAGLNSIDSNKTAFIIDANVNWKIMELTSVKTRDVFTEATLENGMLKGIWGYKVLPSFFMGAAWNLATSLRKFNTAGKVDQSSSQANDTTGAIMAVRFDQWLLGYKRRMTLKVQEFADSDASQIVAMTRVGLAQRDTEASAISYNVLI